MNHECISSQLYPVDFKYCVNHSLTCPLCSLAYSVFLDLILFFLSSWMYQFRNSLFRHVCGWSSESISNSPTTSSVLFCIENKWVESCSLLPSETLGSKLTHLVWLAAQPQGPQSKESVVPSGSPSSVAAVPCLTAAFRLSFKSSESGPG